jgi:transposase-like protein
VIATVLFYSYGLSLRKSSKYFEKLSTPSVSKSSAQEWVRRVGGRLNFDPQPQGYSIIAVDETVVKCNGRPIYVWTAVDAYTRQPV